MTYRRAYGAPDEIGIVQNPALGAFAIWRFGAGYQAVSSSPPLLPLSFLVLPLVFHATTLSHISSTMPGSGLALFAAKLARERENLLAVHHRALAMRELSFASIGVAEAAGLITLDYVGARLRSNEIEIRRPNLPERLKPISSASEKIGRWFAAVGPIQVGSVLAVSY